MQLAMKQKEETTKALSILSATHQQNANSILLPPFFACQRCSVVKLSTAYVLLRDKAGNEISMRALLDAGSQASFITEALA